ncbi:glycosyltransferase family 2 protein [Kyrpidia tusciae]|uniref:Glucosyl-3-phosphoglycerate synthase n=1 Tax=Kyrpidia tusciae (strain DSM 2912 / NBRC 15312 / T2) TaxID=562970 RepID=D5WPI8_KYRT2|nr:glycosyltransferase family 2 protein [Kyrpidia tusciae]ADG06247.1 glycosyl transferase family 2 [Kyrpidia tusciae DSM 2912]
MLSLIIPAYNEEERIGQVLDAVIAAGVFDQVIVVDDGSTDRTAEVATAHRVEVVRLPTNRGKGAAVAAGLSRAQGEVIGFLDADLVGLRPEHIRALVLPVIEGQADMTIGLFGGGRLSTDLAQKLTPILTGQRVVHRRWLPPADFSMARYGIEVLLHKHVKDSGGRIVEVSLDEVTHHMKEEKLGWRKGVAARLRMYWDILKVMAK